MKTITHPQLEEILGAGLQLLMDNETENVNTVMKETLKICIHNVMTSFYHS